MKIQVITDNYQTSGKNAADLVQFISFDPSIMRFQAAVIACYGTYKASNQPQAFMNLFVRQYLIPVRSGALFAAPFCRIQKFKFQQFCLKCLQFVIFGGLHNICFFHPVEKLFTLSTEFSTVLHRIFSQYCRFSRVYTQFSTFGFALPCGLRLGDIIIFVTFCHVNFLAFFRTFPGIILCIFICRKCPGGLRDILISFRNLQNYVRLISVQFNPEHPRTLSVRSHIRHTAQRAHARRRSPACLPAQPPASRLCHSSCQTSQGASHSRT